MSEFMEIVKGRRSIRRYEDKEVPDELLNQIFESIQWSPSWANSQCWEVIAVKDMAVKEQLQAILAPKNPATKAMTAAPVVLVLCGKLNSSGFYNNQVTTKLGDWYMFDLGIGNDLL